MAVFNKYFVTGNKYLANKRSFARYSNSKRAITGSSNYNLYYSPPPQLFFRKCSSARCKTCPNAHSSQLLDDPNLDVFCKAFNVIYKISCNICNMSYIGETCTYLHLRINQHRSNSYNFNPSACYNKSTVELKHFNLHNFKNTTIEILKIHKNAKERLFLESSYMKYYNTLYPFGLNTEVFNKHVKTFSTLNIQNNNKLINNEFTSIYSNLNQTLYEKTTRTKRGNSNNSFTVSKKRILNEIKMIQKEFLSTYRWIIVRKFIFAIKKKNLASYLNVFLNNSYNKHFSDIFYDIIMYKINLFNINLHKKAKIVHSNTQLVMNFSNQVYNKINITSIINDNSCQFPIKNIKISRTFKYPKTLGRRLFNYNSFSKNSSTSSFSCHCNDPHLKSFIDSNHGHIITGDLKIIKDLQLQKLMKYGTKFRLPSNTNVNSLIKQFTYDLDLFIYKIAISYNKPIAYFNQWKCLVIDKLLHELQQNMNSIVSYNKSQLFKQINNLQNNYVITYVDKSPNNYAIICKSYYHQLLNSILSSDNNFVLTNETSIIKNRHILAYHQLLKIPQTNFNYPYLVLIPKFHKNPVKFRTVTIGCNTYSNKASKILLNILKQIYDLTLKHDNTHCLKNSYQLVQTIKKLSNVTNIVTYDFTDLFNNINLQDLYDFINSLFLDNFTKLKLPTNVDIDYFKSLTSFIIKNNYIMYDSKLYLQKAGIAQGGCSSSMLADLFLYQYERNYKNNNLHLFRYIDDIILISTDNAACSLPVNYPTYLTLTRNILDDNTISFLDLKLLIYNHKIIINIYDKRDDFSFHVNTFTNFKSCLHISVYRNIILNHLYRIKNLCSSNLKNNNTKKLIYSAITHGYPKQFIYSIIYK